MAETCTLNGRQMTFAGTADHATHGEGVLFADYFDVRPGEVVFDVGASDSLWTLYGLASGATVWAFEPSVPQFEMLRADVALNPRFEERANLFNVGLGDEDCTKTLEAWYEGAGGPGFEVSPDCTVPVRFMRIDDLTEVARIDWLKVDVEGGELFVLEGGEAMIARHRPRLIIENHANIVRIGPWMAENGIEAKLHAFMIRHGYEVHEEPHQGRSFLIARAK